MALYRAHMALDRGSYVIPKGGIFTVDEMPLDTLSALLELNRVGQVQAPPLAILPGWEARAAQLEPTGITNVDHFVEATTDYLIQHMQPTPTVTQADQWRAQLLKLMAAPVLEHG